MPASNLVPWSPADPAQKHTVTLVLRPPAGWGEIADRLLSGNYDLAAKQPVVAAEPADVQKVLGFLQQNGLQLVSEDANARTIRASGTVQQLEAAFDVCLGAAAQEAMHYQGQLTVPSELDGAVIAILGLDQRAVASSR